MPDETFRKVDERAAQLGINRSEFYTTAARRYLQELDAENLVDQIDSALTRGAGESKAFAELGLRQLDELTADDEW